MEFKDRLMELRKSKGWSQEELGDKLDVSRQTVSKWELGQTTPEMNKLISLSEVFGISLDEFIVGKILDYKNEVIYTERKKHYEYKSNISINGLPLIHINMGYGMYRAKGVIAIGNIATGIIALGIIAMGLISLGAVAIGLLAFAGLALGIVSVGSISVGVLAVGGVAIGYLAIGKSVNGTIKFLADNNFSNIDNEELRQSILDKFPDTPKLIIDLFTYPKG